MGWDVINHGCVVSDTLNDDFDCRLCHLLPTISAKIFIMVGCWKFLGFSDGVLLKN